MFFAGSVISLCSKCTPFGVFLFTSATAALVICISPVAVLLALRVLGLKLLSFHIRQITRSFDTLGDLLFVSTYCLTWSKLNVGFEALAAVGAAGALAAEGGAGGP